MSEAKFIDKVVLVSGAGKGIGKEIALAFAREKADVIFFDKDPQKVAEVESELSRLKIKNLAITLDITDRSQLTQFIEDIKKGFGKVDTLINNVGIGAQKRFFDIDQELLEKVWQTSFAAPFFLTQSIAREMDEGSNIIFVTSIHGQHPSLDPAYDSSKAAVDSLIKNLALQLASQEIRVNGVAPGHIDTETQSLPRSREDVPLFNAAGLPEDIANACLFLADNDKARYITGVVLPVTGGLHIPIARDLKI